MLMIQLIYKSFEHHIQDKALDIQALSGQLLFKL